MMVPARVPARRSVEVALRELGLIERTLIIPDWLQRAELRRRAHAGLNKGEARNVPARACFSTGLVKSATVASGSSATRRSELGDGGYPRGSPAPKGTHWQSALEGIRAGGVPAAVLLLRGLARRLPRSHIGVNASKLEPRHGSR